MTYFTINELSRSARALKNGIQNIPDQRAAKSLEALIDNVLDPLRKAWGGPIKVTSGYRCPALNAITPGASPTSQHALGEAADIQAVPNTKANNKKLYELIRSLNLPVDQCINEYDYSWVHVSYGPRHRRMYFAKK